MRFQDLVAVPMPSPVICEIKIFYKFRKKKLPVEMRPALALHTPRAQPIVSTRALRERFGPATMVNCAKRREQGQHLGQEESVLLLQETLPPYLEANVCGTWKKYNQNQL